MCRILLLAVVFALFASSSSYAQRREALLIASKDGDAIHPAWPDILQKGKDHLENHSVEPGDTLRITFDENSYLPVPVYFYMDLDKPQEQPVLLVMPGDIITVRYNESATKYSFSGKYPAELQIYHDLWRGVFSLGDLSNWGSVHFQSDSLVWMPPTLEEYMRYWQRLRRTGDSLVAIVRTRPGIRPVVATTLTRELQLRTFIYLLKGISYHALYPANPSVPRLTDTTHKKTMIPSFPAAYQDSVRAYTRLLRSMQLLPATASRERLEVLKGFAIYVALLVNKPPTTAGQYAAAKREYKGLEREWVCYSILEDAQFMHRPIGPLLKDYRTWVMPESRFVRSLTHQDQFTLVMPNQQMATTDTLVAPDGSRQTLAALLARHRGKVIYLDLWASWCAPCIMEFPATAALRRHYQGKPVVVIQLSTDKDKQAWQQAGKKFLAGVREQYHFASPTTAGFLKRFTVNSIPRYVLLDKYGIVRYADALRPNDPELKPLIADLLAR
ncbi:TlpA disulfide reductase family protein [Hymenobacter sp. NBH84]|uniref:TlpA family protein disulfide reductase n=1 Tax=Hymenobacter sp. NBH84 TaxID=2596915 RepID=UPI00162A8F7A|nr:TlpA disulfide reductase family protein [Hymenobacter sp. NBH84]